MRCFLGYATYYRNFINGFATLNRLLQKGEVYAWDDACDGAFKTLQEQFEKAIVTALSRFQQENHCEHRAL